MTTIVALSSGRPPAAIGVVRISGPVACAAVATLVGALPPARRASLRTARNGDGVMLDRLLVIVFPGATSATGEDLVELHCHGGRATIDAVIAALLVRPDVRQAEPGEFTRRALGNGRIDLAQAQGLGDLLAAETEAQRRVALAASEGRVSRAIGGWLTRVMDLSARIEAMLDFADEDDVAREATLFASVLGDAAALQAEIEGVLAAPPVERIRDGLMVVIAGPPNSGKSTLVNMMTQINAAIVSPIAGTTRDRIEVPVRRGELGYRLIDTAGLTATADPVERIGVARAGDAMRAADLVLWLGDAPPPRVDAIRIHARSDVPGRAVTPAGAHIAIRADRTATIDALWECVERRARSLVPGQNDLPLAAAQRAACRVAATHLTLSDDLLEAGEQLRLARIALARILGVDATGAMLDALFARFCIGK